MTSGSHFNVSSLRPDWVMCGTELTLAELEVQIDRAVVDDGIFPAWEPATGQRVTLTTHMRTFVMIEAPDYPSAFAALFRDWTPPEKAAGPAVTAGQRELSA